MDSKFTQRTWIYRSSMQCKQHTVGLLLMKKLEKSYQYGDIKKKELVSIVGRQQGKEECWVLNKEIHINSKGVQVEPSESPYFWNNDLNSLAAEVVSFTKRKSFVRALLVAVKKSYGY